MSMDNGGSGGEVLGGLFILLAIFLLIFVVSSFFDESNPVNTTEIVKGKDISHINELFINNNHNHYNVYTNNNSFEVSLEDYNMINIGDNLSVEYDNGFSPILHFNNHMYFAD